jgi:hypothetical protein
MSLDGYIAGPNSEDGWIVMDSEIDFGAIFAKYDTLVMGRKAFARMVKAGQATVPGMKIVVFSRTLQGGRLSGRHHRCRQTGGTRGRSSRGARQGHLAVWWADRCSAVFWKKAWWIVSKWG